MQYYLLINNQTVGPMNEHQLLAYNVNPNTPVSCNGGEWRPLYTYPELMSLLNDTGRSYGPQQEAKDNKRIICGIMAILFGWLGIQYFICGKVGGGFLTILLTLVTCGIWEIITFIQGILMLCMSDQEFYAKYVDNDKTFPLF